MATIYDVAKAAGVSPKTVSRVLNRDAPVGDETRKKVEAEIARLGYVPSKAARMMRSNRSGLVGLITGALSHTLEPAQPEGLPDLYIVQGIQKTFFDSGKTLMVADTGGSLDRVPHLVNTFLEHRVEGLIYVAEHHREVALDLLADCPVVLANCFDARGTRAVLPDDRTCQRVLVERLVAAGHSRIGFLTLDRRMTASGLRKAGYRDALTAAGIAYDPALITMAYDAGLEAESATLMASLEQLLGLPVPPTVLCCGNDEMAMRVYGLLRTRGLRVPEDISIAGFDDYRVISEMLIPPLTTVSLPYAEMGRQAAKELMSMIEGNAPPEDRPRLVAGQVAWRDSVTALTHVSHSKPKGRTHA